MKCWLVTLQDGKPHSRRIIRVSDNHLFQDPPDPKTIRLKLSDNHRVVPLATYPLAINTFSVKTNGSRWAIEQVSPAGNVTLIEDKVISFGRAQAKLEKLRAKAGKEALNDYSEIFFK